ncbi:hypothetical protein UAJ10_02160 [Nitrospirillum sp. BR 11164]|uniref:hypothetical protein n=1 Tax=Nitrospirillum sp. BR 11164 TaxID=3104324 RepID=UPI002AFE8FE8|nr:hypothetical protein [Nitrospirillum sp. BR 11164]MEA1647823.1 hypothetical protein [Nitrospirillum sp. BR 11164]
MKRFSSQFVAVLVLLQAASGLAASADPPNCAALGIVPKDSVPQASIQLLPPTGCRTLMKNGYPVPDPRYTPGAINSSVTIGVLRDPRIQDGLHPRRIDDGGGQGQDLRLVRHPAS